MLRAAAFLALGALLASCSGNPLPGQKLGQYKVVGQPQSNTCGLASPDPWTFSVQLSRSGSTLYWSWMDGRPQMSGAFVTTMQASLKTTQTGNVDGSEAGLGPCTMQRDDDLEIVLGDGEPPRSFSGTVGYSFSVPGGADCSDQLASAGGQYSVLPCTVTYGVTATPQ